MSANSPSNRPNDGKTVANSDTASKLAAGAVGGVVSGAIGAAASALRNPIDLLKKLTKPYAGGKFALEFDGFSAAIGFVTGIEGGGFSAEPITDMAGNSLHINKYPGKPKFDEITLTVGMSMSREFWRWINASMKGKPERRSGALVGYDFDFVERSRRTFRGALISEVGFPNLDAASNSAGMLTVKIAPEHLQWEKPRPSPLTAPFGFMEAVKQKLWLSSNFNLLLDRFKGDVSLRHAKVDSFSIKQNILENPIGFELETRKEVGRLELPTIQVSIPESNAYLWARWYDESVRNGTRVKTTGAITYNSSRGPHVNLMTMVLDGVGILKLQPEKYEAGREGIAYVKATLDVESVYFVPGVGSV